MRFCFFILTLIAVSCGTKQQVPGNILPPEKMQVILSDLMRADEYLTNHVLRDTSIKRDSASFAMYQKIFQLHDVNKKIFDASMDYYELHPEILKPVLDSLEAGRQTPVQSSEVTKPDTL